MELIQKLEILRKCNENLRVLFPEQHVDIQLEEIEKVYVRNVLSFEADAKTKKGSKDGFLTGIQYFVSANLSGIEVCVARSEGCTKACLVFAGRGRFYWTTRQRAIKTLAYIFDKPRYGETLKKSIKKLIKRAEKLNMVPVVRLNGTSDLLWDLNTDIIQSFPEVQFYDYTKIVRRLDFKRPENYHLTFSLSENNDLDALKALSKGVSVAVVFAGEDRKSTRLNSSH